MTKEEAIIVVLTQRADVLRKVVETNNPQREYYLGKLDGYEQAINLLQSSLESIQIEIV